MKRLLVLIGVVVLVGCYSYTPMTSPVPDVGSSIRIDLTDAGSVQLAPTIGQRVESIDGQSVSTTDTAFAVHVMATISQTGIVAHWNKERVDVPRSAVERIRGRQLDTKRSLLTGALAVVGAILVGKAFGLDLGFGGSSSVNGGGSKQ